MEKSKTLLEILDLDGEPNILLDIIDKSELQKTKKKEMAYKYPLNLQLEVYDSVFDQWNTLETIFIKNKSMLVSKMEYLKSYYKLNDKTYRIILIINSKMNKC